MFENKSSEKITVEYMSEYEPNNNKKNYNETRRKEGNRPTKNNSHG